MLHCYKSGTVEKEIDLAFFWYKFEKIGESVSVHEFRLTSSLFQEKSSVFYGRHGENTLGHGGSFSTFPWRFFQTW